MQIYEVYGAYGWRSQEMIWLFKFNLMPYAVKQYLEMVHFLAKKGALTTRFNGPALS